MLPPTPLPHRMFVWRSLLQLPENHAAFNSLVQKGVHPACLTLQDRYPIKSQKLQRGLQRYTVSPSAAVPVPERPSMWCLA